jgi:hypothetical protein
MLRKFLAALVVGLFMSGFAVQSASADTRLTVTIDRPVVLMGTAATFSHYSSVGEASAYDWSLFKYELTALDNIPYKATIDVVQPNSADCRGTVAPFGTASKICSTETSRVRSVFSVAASGGYLKIKAYAEKSLNFTVRAWLDRNGDDARDPYEPSSNLTKLQILDPAAAKPFVDFSMEPPHVGDQTITSWVSTASGTSVLSLIDANLLSVEFLQCTSDVCTTITTGGGYASHPQLQQFEFRGTVNKIERGKYRARLFYKKSATESIQFGEASYDYTGNTPIAMTTSVTAGMGLAYMPGVSLPFAEPRQRTYYASADLNKFTYSAKIYDSNNKPMAGQEVFLYLDTKDIADPTQVYVDGVKITNVSRDQIILRRVTLKDGSVTAAIDVRSHNPGDRIEIDAQVSGLRSYEYSQKASEEVIIWPIDLTRSLSVSTSATAENGTPLNVSALIGAAPGEQVSGEKVLFSARGPLVMGTAVSTLYYAGVVNTTIGLSNFAVGSGTELVTAQVLSGTGFVEGYIRVDWNAVGAKLTAKVITSAEAVRLLRGTSLSVQSDDDDLLQSDLPSRVWPKGRATILR